MEENYRMKRWIGLILLLVPFLAPAAGFWDGNAALQRGDSTFEAGMYAASNSFAENTKIVIVNSTTGKSATVTVTRRIDGQSDILVLLSPPAAAALGISQGTLASVRVTIPEPPAVASVSHASDQTLSQDPDLNPGAAYPQAAAAPADTTTTEQPADQTQAAAAETTTEQPADQAQAAAAETTPEQTPQEESLPSTSTPTETAAAQAVPANTPEVPQPEQQTAQAVATPATAAPAAQAAAPALDEAAIAAAAAARSPQKQLFLPPREDPKFAYQKPVETPRQPVEVAEQPSQVAEQPPAEPQVTAVIGEPGVTPAVETPEEVALADAVAPEESTAQEIVGEGTPAPATPAETAALALASPEVAPEAQTVEVAETAVPAEPVQTEVTGPAAIPPAAPEPPKLALATPEAPAPQKAPEQQTVVATKPADQRTPVATTTTATTTTAAVAATSVQPRAASAILPPAGKPGTYYVQVGAYTTEKIARDLAATLASTYPALVLNSAGTGTPTFRVVVGPLNKAESGTLLTWFKRKGFPDAFLRQE
jgi:hypothetical protein